MKTSRKPVVRHEDRKVQRLIERIIQLRAKVQKPARSEAA